MSLDTDSKDLVQAILEGVALRAAEVIKAMAAFSNVGEKISIDGGVSVNPYFCQFLANTLQKIVSVKSMAELTAIGTAQLAGAGNIILPGNENPGRQYYPEDTPGYHHRFSRAINCVREWRQT